MNRFTLAYHGESTHSYKHAVINSVQSILHRREKAVVTLASAQQHPRRYRCGTAFSRHRYWLRLGRPPQAELARERAAQLGVAARLEFCIEDYRDIAGGGEFDKIVSVGMYEHVGLANLPRYFATIARLLKPGGLMLNHGINAAGPERCRIWRLYMAGMAHAFDRGWLSVAQVLAKSRSSQAPPPRSWTGQYQYAPQAPAPLTGEPL